MKEEWKAIEGFPDYEISNLGRVMRMTSRTCAKAGTILKTPPRSKAHPYPAVDLCAPGSRRRTKAVHILVADAFLEPRPFNGAEVNHKDGNKSDPRADNLEWTTSSGNKLHAYRHGLNCAKGERNGQAKLTAAQVEDIRARSTGRRGEQAAFAREFGVSSTTIRDVIVRRCWA